MVTLGLALLACKGALGARQGFGGSSGRKSKGNDDWEPREALGCSQ